MISNSLKRKLIKSGNTCVRIATNNRGKEKGEKYNTSSDAYLAASKERDKILAEIRANTLASLEIL